MRLGWTQPYMSRRLTGEIPFDVADLEAIADLLGIPATAFFQRPRHVGAAFPTRTRGVIKPETRAPWALAA
jgi:transcriptional regulator with XRE-family HTH domain